MPASQFPLLQGKPSSKHCTNCSSKMTLYSLPGHYDSTLEIDVCMDCSVIWFDQLESIQLSPDGTVALCQLIHERGGTATSAAVKLGEGLRCVTCGEGMRLTNDQVRNTRFAYQACPKGHGRLTTFYNFLAEKQFVRELTQGERAKLAATVQQVRCSGCGAAVNIGKVDACEYCRVPVSVFDRDAARTAIDHYLQERQRQPASGAGDRRATARISGDQWSTYNRADLGTDILFALGRAAMRGVAGAGRGAPAAGAVLPDATSALFGAHALSGAGAAASGAANDAWSALASGATGAVSDALPSATNALFGTGDATSGIASVLGEAGLADTATGVVSDLGGGTIEAVGDVASAAGAGVLDLVTDGIGSLLGALFD